MYLCMYSCSDTYDDLKTNFYEREGKLLLLLFSAGNSHSESVPQQDEVQINIHITLHLRHTFTAQIILNSQTNLESKDF